MAPRAYIDAGDGVRFRAAPAKTRHARTRGGGHNAWPLRRGCRENRATGQGWLLAANILVAPSVVDDRITVPRAARARSRSTRDGGRLGGANAHDGRPGAHE